MAIGRFPLVIAGFAVIATACTSRSFHFLGDAELPTRDQCLANLRTDNNPITVRKGQVLLLDYEVVPCDSPAAEFRVAKQRPWNARGSTRASLSAGSGPRRHALSPRRLRPHGELAHLSHSAARIRGGIIAPERDSIRP